MKIEETSGDDYVSMKKAFGKKLATARKKNGMTQAEFAFAMNVSNGYIGDMERGKINVTLETITKLCLILKTSPAELLPNPNTDL